MLFVFPVLVFYLLICYFNYNFKSKKKRDMNWVDYKYQVLPSLK